VLLHPAPIMTLMLLALCTPAFGFSVGPAVGSAGVRSHAVAVATVAAAAPRFSLPISMEEESATAPAYIEFIEGVPEPVVPDVSLTRSKDGSTGVATFTFDAPSFLSAASEALGETTGMYLKDSEGTMKTSEVTATFTNGKPRFVKGVIVMKSADEWDRFMRFMERYAEANGLGFSKA